MKKVVSIAIDGPSGSGKSTIADLVANKLGILHLNSGSLYRTFALSCVRAGIDALDKTAVIEHSRAQKVWIDVVCGKQVTMLGSEAVDELLRDEKIGMMASTISAYPEIRELVNVIVRRAAKDFGLVAEGRDIGSVVLPKADVKIYLDAKPEIRAKRRFDELFEKVPYEQILQDVIARDKQDSTRLVAPLKRCDDAIYVDSSNLSIIEVCDIIQNEVEKKI